MVAHTVQRLQLRLRRVDGAKFGLDFHELGGQLLILVIGVVDVLRVGWSGAAGYTCGGGLGVLCGIIGRSLSLIASTLRSAELIRPLGRSHLPLRSVKVIPSPA